MNANENLERAITYFYLYNNHFLTKDLKTH